jgi:oxygen-dependent protoporphyrinogen oxidase
MGTTILGGGLGGLSAAYYLLKRQPRTPITLIEATNRVGGWIQSTTQEDGVIFEQGPRTVRPQGPQGANTLALLEELNLSDKIKPILTNHPAATKRLIYANSQLHLLPSSLTGLFKTQTPFSKPLITMLLNDVFTSKPTVPLKDESIYDFVTRRFGKEFGDYLISPMICGICGGNAKEISVKFLMEGLFEKEQKYGSITRGLLADFFNNDKKKAIVETSDLHCRAKQEKWNVYSFDGGMEILPRKLEEACRDNGVNFEKRRERSGRVDVPLPTLRWQPF